MLHNNNLVVT